MAFDTVNPQQMRAIAASMSKKSHGQMSEGYNPDLTSDVSDGQVGSGHGPQGSLKAHNSFPGKPKQGGGGMRIK